MEVPISLVVGVLLLSLGVAVAAVIRTYTLEGRVMAIDRILEPMPEIHRQAAELKARVDSYDKQMDELKRQLESVRVENAAEHKAERTENVAAHDRLASLIVGLDRNCPEPEEKS